jgi:hypothetical protein
MTNVEGTRSIRLAVTNNTTRCAECAFNGSHGIYVECPVFVIGTGYNGDRTAHVCGSDELLTTLGGTVGTHSLHFVAEE